MCCFAGRERIEHSSLVLETSIFTVKLTTYIINVEQISASPVTFSTQLLMRVLLFRVVGHDGLEPTIS